MSKSNKTAVRRRLTKNDIARAVDEIHAYERGERPTGISWPAIVEFMGFSQVSLWKRPEILTAFQAAKRSRSAGATPKITLKTIEERIMRRDAIIEEQRLTIEAYRELWARYEANMLRLGYDPEELRRPLDRINRFDLKSRGQRQRHR